MESLLLVYASIPLIIAIGLIMNEVRIIRPVLVIHLFILYPVNFFIGLSRMGGGAPDLNIFGETIVTILIYGYIPITMVLFLILVLSIIDSSYIKTWWARTVMLLATIPNVFIVSLAYV